MTTTTPWSAAAFRDLLAEKGTFLVPSSVLKFHDEREGLTLPPARRQSAAQPLLGFALGRVVLDEAELLTLAIDPTVQRRGLGRSCLANFEAEAAARGAGHLHLEVAETNAAALHLYRAAGWHQAGRRKAYYKGADARIDAVLMTKHLGDD